MSGVSEVTIRKDPRYLESKKMLHRNHGSASSLASLTVERHIGEKEKLQQEEKIRIAQGAAKPLEPNDKIIIASGTVLLFFANHVKVDFQITVITSALNV
jgi:DeoR family transcriptional regulator of aga operon